MTADDLIHQFDFNQKTLRILLEDVTHEDSVRAPESAPNCINWLLGHLVSTRAELLRSVGAEPEWAGEFWRAYTPAGHGHYAKNLAELTKILDDSMERLSRKLTAFRLSLDEPTHEPVPYHPEGGTWTELVGTYICHEAYHMGQIGLVRRLLGKPGRF